MSFGFKDIEKEKNKQEGISEKKEKQTLKQYLQDLVQGIKFIVNSQRLRSLFLYGGIAWGIFCLMSTYRASLLVDMGVSEQMITVIAAIVGIASSIGSKKQIQFHNRFKNQSLSVILLLTTFSILIAGIMGIMNISYLLRITNTANSMILVGIILLVTVLGLISYMKTRLGLKPEEYGKKEIFEE